LLDRILIFSDFVVCFFGGDVMVDEVADGGLARVGKLEA
jgi:hypothetical protein